MANTQSTQPFSEKHKTSDSGELAQVARHTGYHRCTLITTLKGVKTTHPLRYDDGAPDGIRQ